MSEFVTTPDTAICKESSTDLNTLEPESETSVRNASVSAKVEIPLVVFDIPDPHLAHSPFQHIVAFLALASPNDFSNFRHQNIHGTHGFAVVVHSHVEGLDLRRI